MSVQDLIRSVRAVTEPSELSLHCLVVGVINCLKVGLHSQHKIQWIVDLVTPQAEKENRKESNKIVSLY